MLSASAGRSGLLLFRTAVAVSAVTRFRRCAVRCHAAPSVARRDASRHVASAGQREGPGPCRPGSGRFKWLGPRRMFGRSRSALSGSESVGTSRLWDHWQLRAAAARTGSAHDVAVAGTQRPSPAERRADPEPPARQRRAYSVSVPFVSISTCLHAESERLSAVRAFTEQNVVPAPDPPCDMPLSRVSRATRARERAWARIKVGSRVRG